MDVRLLAAVSGELDGLNVAALCRERGISRKTFYKWRARYLADGVAGLEERSRRPRRSPRQIGVSVEDRIVAIRKQLVDEGLDAGPASIRWELVGRMRPVPSEATIWRVLHRRGLIVAEPKKKPRAALRRFAADFPNECWQIDATEWPLRSGLVVEIINIIDDHSRLCVASGAVTATTTEAAWNTFVIAIEHWGLPTRCLSDNGLAFTGKFRGFEVAFETNLRALGITPITSRPYHPQTCGKVERFQQTLKRWLRAKHPARTLNELQHQLDHFVEIYNHRRPHRSLAGSVPFAAWTAQPAATASPTPIARARTSRKVTRLGTVFIQGKLIHIGKRHAGATAQLVVDATHVVVTVNNEIVRRLELDPNRTYQPSGLKPGPPSTKRS